MPRKMLIWTARVVAAVFLLVAGLALHVELDRLPRFRHGASGTSKSAQSGRTRKEVGFAAVCTLPSEPEHRQVDEHAAALR